MALIFPNRVAQTATFVSGTPDAVDVTTPNVAEPGMRTFLAAASADSWVDGIRMGVLVRKDNTNYIVGIGTWDSSGSQITLDTVELTIGSISNSDTVYLIATGTEETLNDAILSPETAQLVEVSGTTLDLATTHSGKVLCCTNGSAVFITIKDTLPVNFHCVIVQEGEGQVTIDSENTDTCNGVAAGTGVSIATQWRSAYVYQRSAGSWVVVA